MLELHGHKLGVGKVELINWLRESPGKHGVVIDTTKFGKWLESVDLVRERNEVLRELVPYIFEVHYRQIRRDDRWKIGNAKESREIIELLSKLGYQGRIVVEFGWPDLDNPPFGWLSEDLEEFKKLHQEVINFIRNI